MAISEQIPVVAERRRSPRFLYSLPVQIFERDSASSEAGNQITTVVSHDLSASGMRIYSTIPLNQKVVFVRFQGPSRTTIEKEATIVRFKQCNKWMWEYGFEFESPLLKEMLESDAGKSASPENPSGDEIESSGDSRR